MLSYETGHLNPASDQFPRQNYNYQEHNSELGRKIKDELTQYSIEEGSATLHNVARFLHANEVRLVEGIKRNFSQQLKNSLLDVGETYNGSHWHISKEFPNEEHNRRANFNIFIGNKEQPRHQPRFVLAFSLGNKAAEEKSINQSSLYQSDTIEYQNARLKFDPPNRSDQEKIDIPLEAISKAGDNNMQSIECSYKSLMSILEKILKEEKDELKEAV